MTTRVLGFTLCVGAILTLIWYFVCLIDVQIWPGQKGIELVRDVGRGPFVFWPGVAILWPALFGSVLVGCSRRKAAKAKSP